uniref:Uncharacterized protein n=1 Tax=Rhizophora mucronata TaxID=61149 RepID=A0A2P2IY73_RHIMU
MTTLIATHKYISLHNVCRKFSCSLIRKQQSQSSYFFSSSGCSD